MFKNPSKVWLLVFIVIIIGGHYFTPLLPEVMLSKPPDETTTTITATLDVPEAKKVDERPKPLFVIKTYFYPISKSFNESDAVVTLFNAERYKYVDYKYECKRTFENQSTQVAVGALIDLDVSPGICKLAIFRLTCLFPPSDEDINEFYVGVGSVGGEVEYGELTVTHPNKKPYKFVSCMSRMVAVDDWAMIIFAMETFRLFGGELAVAIVECAIREVMDLLRLYEKDGILKVQPGFKPRVLSYLDYDPNTETEYANQVSNSQLCMYDFKESAEFISFPDWDDILIGTHNGKRFLTYYESFAPFLTSNPNAAAFGVNRINAYLKIPFRKTDKSFSLAASLNQTYFIPTYTDQKTVIRPQLVAGNWIHQSKLQENPAYNQISVNSMVATFAHLHNFVTSKSNNGKIPKSAQPFNSVTDYVDSGALDTNFKKMVKRHTFAFDHTKYPYFRLFFRLLQRCYVGILNDLFTGNITYCPTPKRCTFPVQNVEVVKMKQKFNKPFVTGPFTWHERKSVKFITSYHGCL
uniref:Glycosyltransferase family 92 protein n=1 Tax=Panagrellus redivivus TaxID=6233 RepID=A0A7E4VGZ0_PANRE